MTVQSMAFGEMINQSIAVLTNPRIETFERFEKLGGKSEALRYVAAAAAVAGVIAFIFGIFGGIGSAIIGLLAGFVTPLIAFYVFASVLFWIGKQQGGTGTEDEVFYTIALYTAPLLAITGAIGGIPLLGCLLFPVTIILGLYQLYLGYLGARSSMNIDQSKAIISVIVAIIAQWIVFAVIAFIIGLIAAAIGVTTGAFNQPVTQ